MIASTSSTKSGWTSCRAEMLTLTVNDPAVTRSCQASTWRHAWLSTHRPISRIESDSSATRMKSSGPIRPRSGCSQRTSASTPTIRPVAISTIGWYWRTNSRAEIACSRSADSWARATTASCIEGSKTTTRPLPRAFAEYIATSALRSRSPARLDARPARRPRRRWRGRSRRGPRSRRTSPSPRSAGWPRASTPSCPACRAGARRTRRRRAGRPCRSERSTDPRRSPTATSSASPAA